MRPLELIADAILVLGFVALVVGLALVDLALALCVGGGILILVGLALTAYAIRSPARGVVSRGPFSRGDQQ